MRVADEYESQPVNEQKRVCRYKSDCWVARSFMECGTSGLSTLSFHSSRSAKLRLWGLGVGGAGEGRCQAVTEPP